MRVNKNDYCCHFLAIKLLSIGLCSLPAAPTTAMCGCGPHEITKSCCIKADPSRAPVGTVLLVELHRITGISILTPVSQCLSLSTTTRLKSLQDPSFFRCVTCSLKNVHPRCTALHLLSLTSGLSPTVNGLLLELLLLTQERANVMQSP